MIFGAAVVIFPQMVVIEALRILDSIRKLFTQLDTLSADTLPENSAQDNGQDRKAPAEKNEIQCQDPKLAVLNTRLR